MFSLIEDSTVERNQVLDCTLKLEAFSVRKMIF